MSHDISWFYFEKLTWKILTRIPKVRNYCNVRLLWSLASVPYLRFSCNSGRAANLRNFNIKVVVSFQIATGWQRSAGKFGGGMCLGQFNFTVHSKLQTVILLTLAAQLFQITKRIISQLNRELAPLSLLCVSGSQWIKDEETWESCDNFGGEIKLLGALIDW